jgi:FdhD protein
MNSNYKVLKFESKNLNEFDDQISIEEPLEIILKYKDKETWLKKIFLLQ